MKILFITPCGGYTGSEIRTWVTVSDQSDDFCRIFYL